MQLKMIPESVSIHADHDNVTVVKHMDGSQVFYLHRGNGMMAPGHLWQALHGDGEHGWRVTFFVPFGQVVMPEVLKVDQLSLASPSTMFRVKHRGPPGSSRGARGGAMLAMDESPKPLFAAEHTSMGRR